MKRGHEQSMSSSSQCQETQPILNPNQSQERKETQSTPHGIYCPEEMSNHPVPSLNQGAVFVGENPTVTLSPQNIQGDVAFQKFEHNVYHQQIRKSIDSSHATECLKATLQARYRALQIPKLPWLGDWHLPLKHYYVDLTMTPKDDKGRELSKRNIKLQDIFRPTGRSAPPTRILIEGAAGYGKSTLALKLCYDFGMGEEEYMKQFNHVILIPLRQFEGTLDEMILKTLNMEEPNANIDVNFLHHCQRNLLLILDGWDELNPEKYPCLVPLLKSDLFPQATTIVTSRLGSIHLENEPNSSTGNLLNYYDKRIEIKGVQGNNRTMLLQSYLNNFPSEKIATIKQLLQNKFGIEFDGSKRKTVSKWFRGLKGAFVTTPAIDTLFNCPLFILLLVTLAMETDIKAIETKTDLYKALYDFVVRRSLSKVDESTHQVDLFEFDRDNLPPQVRLLSQFGKLALAALQKKEFAFSKQTLRQYFEDVETFLAYGFLTQNYSVDGVFQREWFEPVHMSLLEFAAAYYVWFTLLTNPQPPFFPYIIENRHHFFDTTGTRNSQIVPFVAGLFGKQTSVITSLVNGYINNNDKRCFIDFIHTDDLKCKQEMDDRIAAAVPLVPSQLYTDFLDLGLKRTDFVLDVVSSALASGKTLSLNYNGRAPFCPCLDNPINLDTISFSREYLSRGFWKSPHVRIHTRKLELPFHKYDFRDAVEKVTRSIEFEKVSFTLGNCSNRVLEWLLKAATTGCLTEKRIFLSFDFAIPVNYQNQAKYQCVIEMIGKEKIEGMNVCFLDVRSLSGLDQFVVCASKSQHLKELCLWSSRGWDFDFDSLFNQEGKQWKRLEFSNITHRNSSTITCNANHSVDIKNLAYECKSNTKGLNYSCLQVKSLSLCSTRYNSDTVTHFLTSLHDLSPLVCSLQELFIPVCKELFLDKSYCNLVHLKMMCVFALNCKQEKCDESSRQMQQMVHVLSSLPLLQRIELRKVSSSSAKYTLPLFQFIHTVKSTGSKLIQNIPIASNREDVASACDMTTPSQSKTPFQSLECIQLQFEDVPDKLSNHLGDGMRNLLISRHIKYLRLQVRKKEHSLRSEYKEHRKLEDFVMSTFAIFPPLEGFIIEPEETVESDDDPAWYSKQWRFRKYYNLLVQFTDTQ